MSFLRSDPDIEVSVKKAVSPDETPPKRKHVRACVVYTWDHRSSKAFWHAIRMLPLLESPIMVFKALIVIHKVLHEGHRSVLKEAHHHVDWIRSLSELEGSGGVYQRLIDEYLRLLLFKLDFHRLYPTFNGTFEYEEYISLRSVDDPNEGFEVCLDLMNLQDSIDDFQRVLFASLGASSRTKSSGLGGMECRVSSLTAMVTESYGIYRFATSMLRGLNQQTDPEALDTLQSRYYSQHRRLRNFYFECQGVKYLASLITIPELPKDPPNITESNENAPSLPKRPRELQPMATGAITASETPQSLVPETTGTWWQGQQPDLAAQQAEEERKMLEMQQHQMQLEAELQHQERQALEAQRRFETNQLAILAQQQQQQAELARMELMAQSNDQSAALQEQLAILMSQQDEAQSILQQYDDRVRSLESDLSQITGLTQQQIDAKSEQIASMQEQLEGWRAKYEKLAKLYSQLRNEHLSLTYKHRKVQAKAASAQEAIEKRERAERDLKSKNLELANLIGERDRARYELDKARGKHINEIERLERDISLLNNKVSETDRSKAADMNLLVSGHANQVRQLEQQLADSQRELKTIQDLSAQSSKDDEIAILKEQLTQLEDMIGGLSLNGKSYGSNISSILDAIMLAAYNQVQQALTTFDSPLESGNPNATPPYVLNICDATVANTEEFCDVFTQYVAEGAEGDPVKIITCSNALSGSMSDLLQNIKGLAALTAETENSEQLTTAAREAAANICTFYGSLNSELLSDLDEDDKLELIITNQVEVLRHLQEISNTVEGMLPKASILHAGSLGQQVDGALANLSDAIANANNRLANLYDQSSVYSVFSKTINEAIIAAAAAITSAISELIKAAIECQKEIVANGRQGESPENYYKKNHRWTEGLISAARTVGTATSILIETADGTLSGKGSPEELIVSSREVASSIAQLVAAARVKAGHISKTQFDLESASKKVTGSCRSLVTQVEEILSKHKPETKMIDYSKLSPMEFKSTSMEQQVEVLKLEQELTQARNRLFEIRKLEYTIQEEE